MAEKNNDLIALTPEEEKLVHLKLASQGASFPAFEPAPETAPPTEQPNEQYGAAQSGLEAFGRAPAMGFADELAGVQGAAMEMAPELLGKGPSTQAPENEGKLDRFSRLYQEYRDNLRKREKTQEEEHPIATEVGSLAGGFAIPYGATGNLANLTKAQKLLQLAKTGMQAGAVMGAGTSEASPIDQPLDLAGDVASGSLIGGATGATAGYVGGKLINPKETIAAAEKAGTSLIHESPLLTSAIESFKRGVLGQKLTGTETKRALEREIEDYGGKIFETLKKSSGDLGKARQALIDEAEAKGIRLDKDALDTWLTKYGNISSDIKSNLPQATREAAQLEETIKSAQQGKEVRRVVKEAQPLQDNPIEELESIKRQKLMTEQNANPEDVYSEFLPTDDPNQVVGRVVQKTRDAEGNLTGTKVVGQKLFDKDELGPQFKDVTQKMREGGRDISVPGEADVLRRDIATFSAKGEKPFQTSEAMRGATGAASELSKMTQKAVPGLEEATAKYGATEDAIKAFGIDKAEDPNDAKRGFASLFKKLEDESSSASDARSKMNDAVRYLEKANPEMAQKIGPDIKDMAQKYNILKETTKGTGFSVLGGFTIRGGALAGANIAGRAMKKLTELPPEGMKQLASKMAQSTSTAAQHISGALAKIADRPDKEKNAMLFSLMQSPVYRDLFHQNAPELFEEPNE